MLASYLWARDSEKQLQKSCGLRRSLWEFECADGILCPSRSEGGKLSFVAVLSVNPSGVRIPESQVRRKSSAAGTVCILVIGMTAAM